MSGVGLQERDARFEFFDAARLPSLGRDQRARFSGGFLFALVRGRSAGASAR